MYRSPELYGGIVVLGAFGVCSDRILTAMETRLMRWKYLIEIICDMDRSIKPSSPADDRFAWLAPYRRCRVVRHASPNVPR
jgi:hypothetical protein